MSLWQCSVDMVLYPPPPVRSLAHKAISFIQDSTTFHHLLQILSLLSKTSLDRDRFVVAKFLRRCFSHLSPESLLLGRSLFDRVPAPDAFLWNTVIRAHLQRQNPAESLRLFRRMMLCESAALDSFSLSLSLQACGRLGEIAIGETLHSLVFKLGLLMDVFVQTALVEMYAKVGSTCLARMVFDEMPSRDMVSYNVMLGAYVASCDTGEARNLFDEMPARDLVSWNTMIYGYAKIGDVGAARDIFDRTNERDLLSWSSMISAYAQSRQSNEALRLFHEMQLAKVAPDEVTMVSVLSACGDTGALGMGRAMHRLIERNRIEVDLRLGTALVDMYAKCGDIENSLKVFYALNKRDVLTWSAMIIGLANHGLGQVALDLFSKMISEGIQPNEITFVGVLSACGHVGLVSEGWAHFNTMSDVYGVLPKIEHYGCMVDLLGRAGRIEEARGLIERMPYRPDAVIWRALLNACRIHKNVEVAEQAIENLVLLDPYVDGHYVLLSNIYAQANMWDGVRRMRKLLKTKSIERIPGSSSIEVDNAVHEFVAGDKSHLRCDEIYQMVKEMIDKLKGNGYCPVTSLVLQDIDEPSKEASLAQHSEKLALAFGLLSLPPKSTIRIFKNLRVCEDCHLAMKLVSSVYDRELVVRDRNRFHHFAKGECSCKDYW
ncbi:Pentatricopeptide repeat-containing protein [Canna indica]|uniref:Pentatricopeptide repeat-containing protein n=1 Tax=Canna indica TaxID=4628 RepID=A0AAQ3JU35_9LILI|nr:Pentatricopeptide repeat-containing protein [Canna indica]